MNKNEKIPKDKYIYINLHHHLHHHLLRQNASFPSSILVNQYLLFFDFFDFRFWVSLPKDGPTLIGTYLNHQ
jgi:hypothetical protein